MARFAALGGTIALLACFAVPPAAAWTVQEHRLLADSALSVATAALDSSDRALLRGTLRAPWGGGDPAGVEAPTFGSVCALAAADDRTRGRYHLDGRSVMEQVADLTDARIDTLVNRARRGDESLLLADRGRFRKRVRSLEVGNVVANYLVHHVAALRIAFDSHTGAAAEKMRAEGRSIAAGDRDSVLRCALVYEAIAQSYLADAFAAGHLMPAPGGRLQALHPINRGRLHDHYGNQGVYVMNARGEAWQAFGDRLLLWYGPSFDHVFDTCVESLREVLLAYYGHRLDAAAGALGARKHVMILEARSGDGRPDTTFFFPIAFLSLRGAGFLDQRLEGLMRMPVPVVATWSVRTEAFDAHGLRVRRHYPQFIERGGHDQTLGPEDLERLPGLAAYPDWMVPDALFKTDPLVLIREHPDWASVRFIQPRRPPPSYTGAVALAGQHRYGDANGGGGHHTYGLGYSLAGETPLLVHRMSVDALLLEPIADGGPRALGLALGFNLKLPGLGVWREPWMRWVEHARVSIGHAWGRGESPRRDGPRYTLGLESPAIPVKVTNAALALRVEAEWLRLERPRRGLGVMLVMQ